MKNIKEILNEASLLDIDSTMKQGNEWAKKQKEIDDNKKLLYLLDDLWNNLGTKKNWKTDCFGTSIGIGDIVLFYMDPINRNEMCYGIVIEVLENVSGKVWYDKYRVMTSSHWPEDPIEGDPYNDCITYSIGDEDIVAVLAKKKNAKKMLELLTKIL